MKKWIAAALLAASGSAMADVGPFYVSLPGYCTVWTVYVTPYNFVYGQETGCGSNTPITGYIDGRIGEIATASKDSDGTTPCYLNFSPSAILTGACSRGVGNFYLKTQVRYAVSLSSPRSAPQGLPPY